ncbi:MAG: insulinase family protein [Candidatus Nomurabacteria bacterium]|jgi:predicted Zn-dependent peptidase|nr:insulinase family protein [Candidatus Nomurabacteria bacterium]
MEYEVSEIVLKGGARGLVINVPNAQVMSSQFHFRAGSRFVDDYRQKWETAHIMEHMAFGANDGFGSAHAFDAEFTRNGAYHNAWTSDTAMCYTAECADFEWDRILELQRSAICQPLFRRDEFEGEFGNIKSELTGYLSNPNRVLWPRISREIGEDTMTYRERLDLMSQIRLVDIKNHYAKTHTKGNLRFVIAGNFAGRMTRLKEVLDGFDLTEGDRLPIPVDELHSFEPFAIRRKDVPNVTFGWTMNVPRRLSDDESQAMGMLNHILNGTLHSRIFGAARKKGLVYGIWSETSAYEHNSSWDFGAEVNAEKIGELFEVIISEIMQIKSGQISDDELDGAKSFALGQHQIGVQTVGRLNNWLGDFYFLDGRIEDFAAQPDKIKAVSKQKIIDVANEFIAMHCWGIGIYGNTNKALAEELREKLDEIYK